MSTPIFTLERHPDLQFVGTPGTNAASILVEEAGSDHNRQTVITFTNHVVSMTDATTSGSYGSLQIYSLPTAYAVARAVVVNMTAVPGAGGIGDTATLKYSIGTAAEATNDTLDSTQASVLGSTNATAFVGGVGGGGAGGGALTGVTTTAAVLDARTSAVNLFLNFGIADAGSTANDTVTLNGKLYLTWDLLGR
jgi:galactokinase